MHPRAVRLQDGKNETIIGHPRAVGIVGSQVADRMRGRSIRRHHLLVLVLVLCKVL